MAACNNVQVYAAAQVRCEEIPRNSALFSFNLEIYFRGWDTDTL